jgi:hypothetical protein
LIWIPAVLLGLYAVLLFAKAGPYEIHPDRLDAIRKALGR